MQIETMPFNRKQFVVAGRLFDTAKSTMVAIGRDTQPGDGSEVLYKDVLYRTAKGAFFVHVYARRIFDDGRWSVLRDEAIELSPAGAVEWIENHGAMVKDSTGLPMPEEA